MKNPQNTIFWAVVTIMLLLGLWVLFGPRVARAQDYDTRRWLHTSTYGSCFECRRRYKRYQRPAYRHRDPDYRPRGRSDRFGYRDPQEAFDSSPRCRSPLSREGVEKYNIKEAKESAKSMVMEAIRRHHGTKYMDPTHWENEWYDCNISATGNRGSETTAEVAGRKLQQCTIWVKPCRGQPFQEDR